MSTVYHLCKRHRQRWITVATLTASTCLAWADYGFHFHGVGTSSADLRVCYDTVQNQKNWAGYSPDAIDLECEESDIWYQYMLEAAWHSAHIYKTWTIFVDAVEMLHRLTEGQVTTVKKMFELSLSLKP